VSAPLRAPAAALALLALAAVAHAQAPLATLSLSPQEIQLGDRAVLTITVSGSATSDIPTPAVDGLDFDTVGQSSRVQSINGVMSASRSVTYQVSAHQPGVYTIPSPVPGAQAVVLTVRPPGGASAPSGGGGTQGSGGTPGGAAGAGANPGGSAGATPGGPTQLVADGAAFVRLRFAKHQLYVGESLPIDIEVGLKDGLVASLNGTPTLNGDAFTLNPLPSKPESRGEMIDGKPFTVLIWHGLLSAVKPGSLSLTIQTPLTVRMRITHPGTGSGLADDFDDPFFQNFFGGSIFNLTQKDITVSSPPASFDIEPLPTEGRPASFSGAVGQFSIRSELSEPRASAGDPLRLRLEISGSGNFDRVRDEMLHDVPGWKTYEPSAHFTPQDDIGFKGEKVFDQPVIATDPGSLTLPPITFSYFDPDTRRYEELHTSPLRIEITPAPGSGHAQGPQLAPSTPGAPAASSDGLRPDHVESSSGVRTLRPPYAEPAGLALPVALLASFGLALFYVRAQPREQAARAARRTRRAQLATQPWMEALERAQIRNDPDEFFVAAAMLLKRVLAARWQLEPEAVTLETVAARLGGESDIARVLKLADEARYARLDARAIDLKHWGGIVRRAAGAGSSA
jgi:hypothetical protein